MKLTLNPDALTFGDMEDFEAATGSPIFATFEQIGEDGGMAKMSAKTLVALVWICARLDNPEFTLEDARKVRVDEIEFDTPTPADPTQGSE